MYSVIVLLSKDKFYSNKRDGNLFFLYCVTVLNMKELSEKIKPYISGPI